MESMSPERPAIDAAINERVWAVVGASTDPRKWGYRIYKALLASGYRVYPVNPRARAIDSAPCYRSLAALPELPGVVNVVIPPALGLTIVNEAAALGVRRIWFQPGAESAENIAAARARGLTVIAHACALHERKQWP